jgi:hypothetical protein
MRGRKATLAVALCLFTVPTFAALDELPPIGTIEFYGLGNIPAARIRALLPFEEGDRLGVTKFDELKASLAKELQVSHAAIATVCCTQEGKLQIYVGVQESPAASPYRDAPKGAVRLPAEIVVACENFSNHLIEAIQSGHADEDDSEGHALSAYPPLRGPQEKFKLFARRDAALLRKVLRDSSDASHRAMAAQVLGYAPDKRAIVGALTHAVSYADAGVRNDATRAVSVIPAYALKHPELGIEIDPLPFARMLDSLDWTDLNKATFALYSLSVTRDPSLIRLLRGRRLQTLIDMCRWQSGHGIPACVLLRRITGLPEDPGDQARAETLMRAIALAGADGPEPPS